METKYITVVTGAVVKKEKGETYILLEQRFEPECPEAHLKWELPGGKVEIGETAPQAVEREIKEETGIACRALTLLQHVQNNSWQYASHLQQVLVFTYLCEYVDGEIEANDHHVKQAKWCLLNETDELDLLPGVKNVIQETRITSFLPPTTKFQA